MNLKSEKSLTFETGGEYNQWIECCSIQQCRGSRFQSYLVSIFKGSEAVGEELVLNLKNSFVTAYQSVGEFGSFKDIDM
jgi:hypothetical protein